MHRYLNPPFQNQCPLFLLPLFFQYLNPQVRINKMVKEHTVDQHPSSFSINLKDTSSQTSMDSLRLFLSPEYLLNFLSNMHIQPLLGGIFKFMVFRFLNCKKRSFPLRISSVNVIKPSVFCRFGNIYRRNP